MIGVEDLWKPPTALARIKRDILFFDSMIIVNAHLQIEMARCGPFNDTEFAMQFGDELEFLLDTPYFEARSLDDYYIDRQEEIFCHREFADAIAELSNLTDIVRHHEDVQGRESFQRSGAVFPFTIVDLPMRLEVAYQHALGNSAAPNRELLLPKKGLKTAAEAVDILRLAIGRVSVPHEQTPWQDILDLKSDKDFQNRARKLRLWAYDTAKPGMTLARANEQLSDAISDYETYLKAYRMKFSSAVLKISIVGTAEFIEDITHLRFGRLIGRFFAAKSARADMLLSEMKAPGRAVSVVTSLKERFR